MGLPKAVSEGQQDNEGEASHDDIMALLRNMQAEQRAFRKEVNKKIDAIETHNHRQDANLRKGARHMADIDADVGMLSQYMNSMQSVKEALNVMERAFVRLKASSARRKLSLDEDTPTNPSNPKPEATDHIDTIPAPSPPPDSETGG